MTIIHQQPVFKGRSQAFSPVVSSLFQNSQGQGFTPAVDLWETPSGYELEVALPGVKREDLSVEFQEGVLTVSGKRAFEKGAAERKYHKVENLYGSFSRSFKLPDHVDTGTIDALLENGVLHVSVPKVAEKVIKRQIEVK